MRLVQTGALERDDALVSVVARVIAHRPGQVPKLVASGRLVLVSLAEFASALLGCLERVLNVLVVVFCHF